MKIEVFGFLLVNGLFFTETARDREQPLLGLYICVSAVSMAPAHADWVRRGLFQRKRVVIDLIVLELPEMPSSAIFACLPARLNLPSWGLA